MEIGLPGRNGCLVPKFATVENKSDIGTAIIQLLGMAVMTAREISMIPDRVTCSDVQVSSGFVVEFVGSRGSRRSAVVRALASHQCGLGSIPIHMWVTFLVLYSYPRGFSPGTPVSFLSSSKTNL